MANPTSTQIFKDDVLFATVPLDGNGNGSFTDTLNDQNPHNYQNRFPAGDGFNGSNSPGLQITAQQPPNENTTSTIGPNPGTEYIGQSFTIPVSTTGN